MNARHRALIFHLQSRPCTHLFLVTEKHCHAPCPCSAALPGEGTITRDNRADCGQEQWGKECLGLQGRAARLVDVGRSPPGPCHHRRMLWAPCSPGLEQVMWKKHEYPEQSMGMSEEGQCLSKLCPSVGHGKHLLSWEDTGTRYREGKADYGHGKPWRGAGTEKGTKMQVAEKNMESHRLKITFSISLRFPCRCHFEELLPTCHSCGAWRQRGVVPERG